MPLTAAVAPIVQECLCVWGGGGVGSGDQDKEFGMNVVQKQKPIDVRGVVRISLNGVVCGGDSVHQCAGLASGGKVGPDQLWPDFGFE